MGRLRPHRGALVVASLGLGTLGVHGYHLAAHDLTPLTATFGAVIPLAFSATLLGFAGWLATAGYGADADRVGMWSVVGAVALLAIGSVNIAFQIGRGVAVVDAAYVLVTGATGGALLGFLLGVYDVDRLATRRALERERASASQLGRQLTVLNRVLRHDVRNRVNVIRGNADLIAKGTGAAETAAETIKSQAEEMHHLSEQARELEAVLSEETVDTEPVDLAATLEAKAMAARAAHSYATVHVDVPEAATAEVSPRIDSVVDELVENAIVHNDAAEPTVWIEAEVDGRGPEAAVDESRGAVVVRVADDGPGIPEDEVAVLERGHETALEHASGLGLWLVNWIVTRSGGAIDFESRAGGGSVVELTLPQADAEGEVVEDRPGSAEGPSGHPERTARPD